MAVSTRSHRRGRSPAPAPVRAHHGLPRRGRRRILGVLGQGGLITVAALAYFGVRSITQGSEAQALANARSVVATERMLGIASVSDLQRYVLRYDWLVTAANWIYVWGHWPVIGGTLLWLYLRHPEAFGTLRNAMFISGAIGLVIFATFPVAPPRLAGLGVVDTVTLHSSSYRTLQPPGLVNQYAAMQSLHFGWNLLLGLTVWRVATPRAVRLLALALPVTMAFSVVATANHFAIDVVAGGVVALAGLALVPWLRRGWVAVRPP